MKHIALSLALTTIASTAFAMEKNPQPLDRSNIGACIAQQLLQNISNQYTIAMAAADADDHEAFLKQLDKLEPLALEFQQKIELLRAIAENLEKK